MLQEPLLADRPNGTNRKQRVGDAVTSEAILVTPEIARAWLDKNAKNRKVASGTVSAYARDMKGKKWLLTGDAIRFDKKGNLIDGQHRLRACIEADSPFPSLVIYGLDPPAQDQIDTGKPRRINDVLAIHGFHNTITLAAVARMIYMLKHDEPMRTVKLTNSEINAIVKKHPGLHRSITASLGTTGASRTLLALVHYLGACVLDKEKRADAFIDVWTTGKPDYEGDPVHKLRERLLRQKTAMELVRRDHVTRLMFHAWNLFAKKKTTELLRAPEEAVIDGLDISKL